MCNLFPEALNKLKMGMRTYDDPWKRFMKVRLICDRSLQKMIMNVDYFENLTRSSIEEILYSLRDDFYEKNSIVFRQGEPVHGLMFLCEGELDIIVKMHGEQDIIIDTLYQGCNVGAYSLLSDSSYTFYGRARTHLKVKFFFKFTLQGKLLAKIQFTEMRKVLVDVDNELRIYETYIQSKGNPICDFKFIFTGRNQPSVKEKFLQAVRRLIVLNRQKEKKKLKLAGVVD